MIIAAAVADKIRCGDRLCAAINLLGSRKTGTVKTVAFEDLFCIAQKTPTIAKDYLGTAMESLLAFPRVQE
ncbi:MAG TPA: hypothetical protein VFV12_02505 [Xanthobacteraceae bacterium]|nr:hypothetical protein [Xanthobacteraceae bacterium]